MWTTPVKPGFVLAWSRWRRRHQARARRAHYANGHDISLVFSDLQVTELPTGYAPFVVRDDPE